MTNTFLCVIDTQVCDRRAGIFYGQFCRVAAAVLGIIPSVLSSRHLQ